MSGFYGASPPGADAKIADMEVRGGKRVSGRSAFPNTPHAVGFAPCDSCGHEVDRGDMIRTGTSLICEQCDLMAETPAAPTAGLWFAAVGAAVLGVSALGAMVAAFALSATGGETQLMVANLAAILAFVAAVPALAIGLPIWRQRNYESDLTGQSAAATGVMAGLAATGIGLAVISGAALFGYGVMPFLG